MSKIRCPKYGKTKRNHVISMIGDLVFECSCGEVFELTDKDVGEIYNTISKSQTKRIVHQVKGTFDGNK